MKTAVAAADFEAHEELRLLLWSLLQKRVQRIALENEMLLEFAGQDLKRIAEQLLQSFHAGDPEL